MYPLHLLLGIYFYILHKGMSFQSVKLSAEENVNRGYMVGMNMVIITWKLRADVNINVILRSLVGSRDDS